MPQRRAGTRARRWGPVPPRQLLGEGRAPEACRHRARWPALVVGMRVVGHDREYPARARVLVVGRSVWCGQWTSLGRAARMGRDGMYKLLAKDGLELSAAPWSVASPTLSDASAVSGAEWRMSWASVLRGLVPV